MPLVAGNELRVGPLKFRIDVIGEKSAKNSAPSTTAPTAPKAKEEGKSRKHPPVKNVADVVQRTMSMSDSMTEDDVSRWLLGVTDVDGPETLKETRSLKAEETRTTMTRVTKPGDTATVDDVSKLAQAAAAENEEEVEPGGESADDEESAEEGSGVWSWLKRGKGGSSKKKPGKLPPRTDQEPTKDSREAAADILREMQRRR